MKVARSYANYTKLQNQAGHLTDAQWQSREEELRKETLQQIECHMSNLQQRESE